MERESKEWDTESGKGKGKRGKRKTEESKCGERVKSGIKKQVRVKKKGVRERERRESGKKRKAREKS